jgi:hypothetical protein
LLHKLLNRSGTSGANQWNQLPPRIFSDVPLRGEAGEEGTAVNGGVPAGYAKIDPSSCFRTIITSLKWRCKLGRDVSARILLRWKVGVDRSAHSLYILRHD